MAAPDASRLARERVLGWLLKETSPEPTSIIWEKGERPNGISRFTPAAANECLLAIVQVAPLIYDTDTDCAS